MKKATRLLSLLLGLVLLISCFAGCASGPSEPAETTPAETTPAGTTATETTAEITTEVTTEPPVPDAVVLPRELGNCVTYHTDLQMTYLMDRYANIARYAGGTKELSRPTPITLKWSVSYGEGSELDDTKVKSYRVSLSENEDMSDAVTYTASDTSYQIYNLKADTEYFWTVEAVYGDKTFTSEVSEFQTEAALPRNLYVDGITNVRDLGGWKTANGGRVRQGLLIRCGRLNSNSSATKEITSAGIKTMLDGLGIKSEIDLRLKGKNGNITESPLGNKVNYYLCPMAANSNTSGVIMSDNVAETAHVFKILADENNYPIIFHCSIGTDRTGMIAFLVNGLLGVSLDDLYRDYLYSNFGNIGSARTTAAIGKYESMLRSYEGATLSDRIRSYLLSIGVTQDEINSVIRILRDDTNAAK